MGNKDWGRLIARVLAVMLVARAMNTIIWMLFNVGSYSFVLFMPLYLILAVTLAIGVLLWIYSDRFAPATGEQEGMNQTSFGTMIVVAVAMYLAFTGVDQFLTAWFDLSRIDGLRPPRTVAQLSWNAVLVLVAAVTIFNSRRVTRWMLR